MALRKLVSVVALALAFGGPSLAHAQECPSESGSRCAEIAAARGNDRVAAERLVTQAEDSRGFQARALYRQAGDAYLVLWQTYYADPCRGDQREACSRADEVLYNASRALQAGGDLGKASQVRRTLIDRQFHLDRTYTALKALHEEGSAHQAIGEYGEAAEWYERFAKESPKDENAPEALLDAVVLRLALHEPKAAEQNAELWTKLYAAKSVAKHASLVVAIAQSKRDAGAPPREVESYLSSKRAVVAKAQSEHQPAVDVMLGNAIAARGDLAAARPHFERAAAYEVLPLIKRLSTEEENMAMRRLGKALIGIADAHLWLADRERDAVMKLTIRKSDPESLKKKREAIKLAEKQYAKVLDLQPVPPPIGVVEAAARVARMRGQLWAQAHLELGPETADQLLVEAKAAYHNCVDLGAKYQAQTPASAGCARWLERHYPQEYPRLTELMPQPKWSKTRFAMPRPLDDDGEEPVATAP